MKYVIDTHALIWFLEGNERLGPNAVRATKYNKTLALQGFEDYGV
jgi:PIN domain nuclease of toxin-antitoxin system